MIKKEDFVGKRFGRLVVIDLVKSKNEKRQKALCRCDCGKEKLFSISNLKKGDSQSCGCLQKERTFQANRLHGATGTKLHNEWRQMKARCYIRSSSNYSYYGGRGIKVCNEWLKSFDDFRNWALKNGYNENLTLDRIDVNKDYSPDNCRWVSMTIQSQNRRPRSTCKTGVSGVMKRNDENVYRVTIGVNGKRINIGQFSDFSEAVQARKEAELKYWGYTIIK